MLKSADRVRISLFLQPLLGQKLLKFTPLRHKFEFGTRLYNVVLEFNTLNVQI